MNKKIIAVALAAVIMSGCSSIVSKSQYAVAVNSNPDGASFVIANSVGKQVHSGTTPSSVTLKSSAGYFKGETYTLVFNKDGYSEKTYTLTSTLDGWYFGNILFGGLIGMLIVDPMTGAMYNLPDRVDVNLDQSVVSTGNDALTIASIDTLSADQISRLVKL